MLPLISIYENSIFNVKAFSPINFSYEHVTPSQYKAMQLSGQIPMNAPIIASALLNQSSINPMVKNGQPAPPGAPSGAGAPTAPPPGGAEVNSYFYSHTLKISHCRYKSYIYETDAISILLNLTGGNDNIRLKFNSIVAERKIAFNG